MPTIRLDLHDGYDVQIAEKTLVRTGEFLIPRFSPRLTALITDTTVDELYAATVEGSLRAANFTVVKKVFPAGEQTKSLASYTELLTFLAQNNLTKADLIIALGGGVTGDLAGFAAATFLRGVNFIQLPTTLLAMVDSAVGGKTAVNLPQGKNLVGAFYQPHFVLTDLATLTTLPEIAFADGAAEIIKYGILADPELFAWLEAGKLRENLEASVVRSVEIKRNYVVADERDESIRQFLNLGHTFGHAIEKLSDYRISHGHAVAMGMLLIARGAVRKKMASADLLARIIRTLQINNLPTTIPFATESIINGALNDKKRRGDFITVVLPRLIGDCVLEKIPITELRDFLEG